MPRDVLVEARAVAADEEVDEHRQVLDALAQRRQPHRNHVEAVVEIFAERAVLDRALEVDVGRRDQPERGADRPSAADALDLALLDRAQQLGLQVELQIADLVEEQRAAVGQLELADALLQRAGERALLVAEQRALDQLARNRRHVDGDERAPRDAPIRDAAAAPAAPCRCRSRRGSAPWRESFATLCTVSSTSRSAGLGPVTNSRSPALADLHPPASARAGCRSCRSPACWTIARSASGRTGLVRK